MLGGLPLLWSFGSQIVLSPAPHLTVTLCLARTCSLNQGTCLALAWLFALLPPPAYSTPLTGTSISPSTYRIPSFLLVSPSRGLLRGMSISSSCSLRAVSSLIMVLNTA